MKLLLYVVSLLLSLPNLIAGTALLLLQHTFSTRRPLQIIADFLFEIVWGLPLAGFLFLLLFVAGFSAAVQPHAAMFAFVLNATALGLVLFRLGLPGDFDGGIFFLPIALALIGFAWITYQGFASRPGEVTVSNGETIKP
jgi:hypothetical protein